MPSGGMRQGPGSLDPEATCLGRAPPGPRTTAAGALWGSSYSSGCEVACWGRGGDLLGEAAASGMSWMTRTSRRTLPGMQASGSGAKAISPGLHLGLQCGHIPLVALCHDPFRQLFQGIARAMFRVAVSGRREQEASFFTVIVWRDQAEHAAQSLSKGSRVVVVGRLQQRAWTAEDGSARSTVEVVADELGPSLRWATATPVRATRSASDST